MREDMPTRQLRRLWRVTRRCGGRTPWAIICAAIGVGHAATVLAQADAARMDHIVQSYVAAKQFMGSVLVARGQRALLDKGYGYANLEWQVPNTPDSKFRLGSITKQVTAASVLLLEERGKIRLTDPVMVYMPDAPAAWDHITIYNLLTHTSGIPDFTSFPDYTPTQREPTTPAQLVARFRNKPLDFPPGTSWKYSNSGYEVLGYLIEKISGMRYKDFVKQNLLRPQGMNESGYDTADAVIPHRASGYTPDRDGPVNAAFLDMSIPYAAGGLYSTTHDLWRWERALFGGQVLSASSLKAMTTPFKNDYALGLAVHTVDGRTVTEHGGGINGFNTVLAHYPADTLTVIVLANLNGSAPDEIARDLATVAHGETVVLPWERTEVPVSPAVLARYVGTYQLPHFEVTIALDSGRLTMQLGSQTPDPLYAESDTTFFRKDVDAQIAFMKNSHGEVAALVVHRGDGEVRAERK